MTQDVHAHHRNSEVCEEKHGVKPGAFAAVQHRCHGHQQICHKMNGEEATHLKRVKEEEGGGESADQKASHTIHSPKHLVSFTRMIRNNKLSHARNTALVPRMRSDTTTSCRRHGKGGGERESLCTCLIEPLRAFASMRAEENPHHQATEAHSCRRNIPRVRGIQVLRLVVEPFVFQSVLTVCPRGGGIVAVVVLLPLVLQPW